MNAIESYIQQRIKLVLFYKKIFIQKVVRQVLLRLVIVWIKHHIQCIRSGVVFCVYGISYSECIACNQRFFPGHINHMRYIIPVGHYKLNLKAIKSYLADIFKSNRET